MRPTGDARPSGEGYHQGMEPTVTGMEADAGRRSMLDALMALGITVFVWLQLAIPPGVLDRRIPLPEGAFPAFRHAPAAPPIAYVLAALCVLPLALRRRRPVEVLVAVSAAAALFELAHFRPAMTIAGPLIALYTVGSLLERRRLLPWAALSVAIVTAASLPALSNTMFWPDLVRTAAVLLFAVAVGDATRNRRAYVREVEQRAADAERTRDEEARRRVDEERLRIARELHDITAHSLSIVAVQSGAALHVLDDQPAEARKALVAIRETSRDSLAELRAMLGVLRGSEASGGDVPLSPTPGLARIAELVAPVTEAGIEVTVLSEPGPEPLPAIVDASAYRIVQEALTNVLRHAGGAHVSLEVRRDGDTLVIVVEDDGAGETAPADEGHGIAGMRERAHALGGTFTAGPRAGGGWAVRAMLPLHGRSS